MLRGREGMQSTDDVTAAAGSSYIDARREDIGVESKSGDSATFLQDRARQFHFKYALRKHEAAVYDVAYSPCGAMLASAAFDKTVKIWHMEESMKQQAQSLAEHTSLVSGVSSSAQSTSILSGGFD